MNSCLENMGADTFMVYLCQTNAPNFKNKNHRRLMYAFCGIFIKNNLGKMGKNEWMSRD